MASSVRHTNGDFLTNATRPTVTGDWDENFWVHPNAGEYGDGVNDHVIIGAGTTGGSSEGWAVGVLAGSNTALTIFVFRNGGAEIQSAAIATGSFVGEVCGSVEHASGSASYTVRWRLEKATTWNSTTLTLTTQLAAAGSAFIGTDQFNEHAVDSDTRAYRCKANTLSNAALLTQSQAINSDPAGANLHSLNLIDVASAATNGGTGGTWTITGTLQNAAVEPAEAKSDNVALAPAQIIARPTRASIQELIAPVGALIAAASLTSIAWTNPTHQPPAPKVSNPPTLQPVAPIGTLFTVPFTPGSSGFGLYVALPPTQPVSRTFVVAVAGNESPAAPALTWLDSYLEAKGPAIQKRTVEPSAPIGTGTFALSKIGWYFYDQRAPSSPVAAQPTPSSPVGSLLTGALSSLGWLGIDARTQALSAARAIESASPIGPLKPFVSLSTGFFGSSSAPSLVPAPRAQDPQQPVGPLTPFVSPSVGWFSADLVPDQPLVARRVSETSPAGTLLTPQPFGWHAAHQDRPTPVLPRRPEPSAPVGTAFAIALPSNGWLATDNPRTPLQLHRDPPNDPVGSPLAPVTLPGIGWLATDNPRTPLALQRAVPVDPVGAKFFVPPALGPFWFVDLPARGTAPGARVASSEPIGALFSSLTSIGWLAPADGPRATVSAIRQQPVDPISGIRFGGAPWVSIEVQSARPASARAADTSAPVGALLAGSALSSLGWLSIDLPARQFASLRTSDLSAPVGQLLVAALSSLGWQVSEAPRAQAQQSATPQPSQAHIGTALAFGGAPWLAVELAHPAPRARQQAVVDSVGALLPQIVLPSMGWQSAVELPPRWSFVSRPLPSQPVGSAFAIPFTLAPLTHRVTITDSPAARTVRIKDL